MSDREWTETIVAGDEPLTVWARQCDPPGRMPGVAWVVELHTAGDVPPYPVATAYLSDFRRPLAGVCLDFILVPDDFRRQGYAEALVRACKRLWPGLWLTDPISPEGEALVNSLEGQELFDATAAPTTPGRGGAAH